MYAHLQRRGGRYCCIIMTILSSSPRRALLWITFLSLSAVTIALISQYHYDMPPCAWCVMQRLIYLVIAVLALVGALLPYSAGQRAALIICLLFACVGIAVAWYQHNVAAQLLSCDMTFADRFMTGTGLEATFPLIFGIYATCMDAAVTVLGVEYAVWSLGMYGVVGTVAALGLMR